MRARVCVLGLAALVCVTALPSPPLEQIPFSLSDDRRPTSSLAHPDLASLSLEHRTQLDEYLETYTEPRLVQLRGEHEPRWVTEGGKALLVFNQTRFVDVTDDEVIEALAAATPSQAPANTYPKKLKHRANQLRSLFDKINLVEMKHFLRQFTDFYTRHYRSTYGVQSQLFLLNHLKELHTKHNPNANLTFTEFQHSSWDQKSIIVRWSPRPTNSTAHSAPVIILSAHQDSTGPLPFLRAPGADDDGSGTAALVEVLSVLLQSGWEPTDSAVEWMFLSAEECGLCGSSEVVKSYKAGGRQIRAMYHMDVTAYLRPGTEPVIGLITDGVSPTLTDYIELLINEYATLPAARTQCGYACSDHGSFDKAGYPAACLSEGKFADSNPDMHTAQDTIDRPEYSLEHVREFVRIGLGYVVELAGRFDSLNRDGDF
ncbi:hypothetical protein JCM8115_004554 [Rhodotorula mucilaginosa]|nr:hypothetical protein B0A53_05991 [Rhodotorula sp. CCFEE 5036]